MGKRFGYARVSTTEQNLDRQLKALSDQGIESRDIITDKASGKDLDRPGYSLLKNHLLREGDVLMVKSLDRLSRNKQHMKQELEYYKEHHIRVMVIDLPTTMAELPEGQQWVFEMINNILIEVLASIAEQERVTTRLRQAEGIAAAHANGKHLGRSRAQLPQNWAGVYERWTAGLITAKAATEELQVSRSTFYNLAKKWRIEENGMSPHE